MTLRVCSGTPLERCGRIIPGDQRKCDRHQKPARKRAYFKAAREVRATATVCWLCDLPFSPDDPPVADHVTPRIYGGSDDITNLRAAHRSCNGRRGQTLRG